MAALAPVADAVPSVVTAVADPNLDVRKAAVRALTRWSDRPDVASALRKATEDTDADVRAYARIALDDGKASHDVKEPEEVRKRVTIGE
ncbi:HEAT repeat domain-containing protein [Actinokineospora soli]|uniref:HEAT repeat domain-containing protein n=1 Tax=Actinokineospora soli TaxID=1048753 RepID=A0ABW2TL25_9PSEU